MSAKRQPTATLDESMTATLDEPTIAAEPLTLVLAPDDSAELPVLSAPLELELEPDDRDQLPVVTAPLTLAVVEDDAPRDQPVLAAEPHQPQEPLTLAPPANDVQLVGRVLHHKPNTQNTQNRRGKQNRQDRQSGRFTKLHKGGAWLEYQLLIDELVAPGVVETTQIPFLIPSGRHDLKQCLRGDQIIRVHGRLDRDAEFDTRYGKQTSQGGTITQRVFIKAGTIDVFETPVAPAMHAVLRVRGTVRRVVQVARTLGRHDTQKFHLVSIFVVERYARQAPATGMVTYEQTLQVAVPIGDTDTLRSLLRPGNPVALELGYRLINDWASDKHHSLDGIEDPKRRDQLRKQSHEYLTVTKCTPLDGVVPLTDAEMERIVATARAQQKKQEEARRKQREAAAAMAAAAPAV
jgi:hypothetical protein